MSWYAAMLSAAMRGIFDVLVAEDISRLWRNMEMQTRDINDLLELRISIVTQAEDTRRENDLMMLNPQRQHERKQPQGDRPPINSKLESCGQLFSKAGSPNSQRNATH